MARCPVLRNLLETGDPHARLQVLGVAVLIILCIYMGSVACQVEYISKQFIHHAAHQTTTHNTVILTNVIAELMLEFSLVKHLSFSSLRQPSLKLSSSTASLLFMFSLSPASLEEQ